MMMVADDIMICRESREQVKENLKSKYVLERRGMKARLSKREYMCVNKREASRTVRLQGVEGYKSVSLIRMLTKNF